MKSVYNTSANQRSLQRGIFFFFSQSQASINFSESDRKMQLLIIGTGIAGTSCAVEACRQLCERKELGHKVLVFTHAPVLQYAATVRHITAHIQEYQLQQR